MKKTLLRALPMLFVGLLFALQSMRAQTNYYVNASAGDDSGDGLSSLTAKKTIQAAIDIATSGGVINLANGTYSPSGAVSQFVNITKSVTIRGASKAGVIVDGTVANYINAANFGFKITASNVVIEQLTVRNFETGIGSNTAISTITVTNVASNENYRYGFYSNASINGLLITNSEFKYNGNKGGIGAGSSARGIMLQSTAADYSAIEIDNNDASFNQLVGIDFAGSNLTNGIKVTNNVVHENGDSGIGVWLGKNSVSSAAVLIGNNNIKLAGNSRFGIEIKNAVGTGASSGVGSVVVSGNQIDQPGVPTNSRDFAAIAVLRRKDAYTTINDQCFGVYISGNTISNIKGSAAAEGDGFGIVIGGTGHTVVSNAISNTGIAIQLQKGNVNYDNNANSPSTSGDANTFYFDRDNSGEACAYIGTGVSVNTFSGNGTDVRYVTGAAISSATFPELLVTNNNTLVQFCSIQSAINAPSTVAGDVINVKQGTYTLTTAIQLNKGVTLQGNNLNTAAKPIITGSIGAVITSGDRKNALIEVDAPNVKIQNFEFQINQEPTYIGISSTNTDNFNNLEISDNVFKGTHTQRSPGYDWYSQAIRLGRGSAAVEEGVANNQISIVRNEITYANLAAPQLFGRGIYAFNTYGKIGGSDADKNIIIAAYGLQGGELGGGVGKDFEFSWNHVPLGIVSTVGAEPGNHKISNNTIGAAIADLAQANNIVRLLEIKGNRTANAKIEVSNNKVSNYANIGIYIQRSDDITIKDNELTPMANATAFNSIVFSTKEGTSGTQSAVTLENLTITGNDFNGSGIAGGTGIAFWNHNGSANKPLINAKVGGADADKNTFALDLNAYISLDATPPGGKTTGAIWNALYDVLQTTLNETNIFPFNGDVDASYNDFGGIDTETETDFDVLLGVKEKIIDGMDNPTTGYVNIQPKKAFIANWGTVVDNAFAVVPDGFTMLLKNDDAVYHNLGSRTITKAYTFAIDSYTSGEIMFGDLQINAPSKEITFAQPTKVNGAFALTSGKVTPSAGITLAGTVGATTIGISNFINGKVTVSNVNSDILIPVGKGNNAAYVELTGISGASSVTAEYFSSGYGSLIKDLALTTICGNEYWNVTSAGGLTANVKLYSYDLLNSELVAANIADAVVARYNSTDTKWETLGSSARLAGVASHVTANNAITDFGYFTFGTITTVLPVKLTSFTAQSTIAGALLKWSTSEEENNAKFMIEKSFDGKSFFTIDSQNGKGNSSTVASYEFLDLSFKQSAYYRLVQVDASGRKTTYTDLTKFVKGFDDALSVVAYPNPVTTKLYVTINSANKENVKVLLTDLTGKALRVKTADGLQPIELDVAGVATGAYILQVIKESGNISKKILKL